MWARFTELFLKYDGVVLGYLINILLALVIFLVGNYLSTFLSRLLKRLLLRKEVDPTLIGFSSSLLKYTVLTLTIITVLGRLGLETASFVAILGAAGLAIGLALQSSLSNFAAGILLLIFRPFKEGDLIDVGMLGTVESIQIFSTTLTLSDGRIVVIPNSKISANNIINYTRDPNRRIDLTIAVEYGADILKVKQTLMAAIKQTANVLADRSVSIRLDALADSSLNFSVQVWVTNSDYSDVRANLLENIKNALDNNQIKIPYPTIDLNLNKPIDNKESDNQQTSNQPVDLAK
ncbi:mechanosensitive ion channel [Utexia brackfieldae]|uniref:mechanosensitive ion channel domain-containing protein n=1 Tax=Utexia brackfieldae TaxID=3074108 RepID=UPI00370D50B7